MPINMGRPVRQDLNIAGMCCRPAGNEIVEEGKKKTEEEVKAEQEAVSKEQTAALKKALAQITVSLHYLAACPKCMVPSNQNITALLARDLCFLGDIVVLHSSVHLGWAGLLFSGLICPVNSAMLMEFTDELWPAIISKGPGFHAALQGLSILMMALSC